MEFTGTNLCLTRSLYTQTGQYGFALDCTVDNTSGQYLFGLSGSNGTLEFKLESGHMSYQNRFIHTYKAYQQFSLEAEFTSGTNNVIKDGTPLLYGINKSTGYFDTFYMKRANAGMGASFDLQVSGNNTPAYSITTKGYLLVSGQAGVTGYFVNQSTFPVRVFDSSIQASQLYDFGKLSATLSRGATGTFSYSGDFSSIDLTQPILTTFNTNFNDTSILFTIVDASSLNRFVYLTGPTDFTFNNTGILNRDATYLNYSGGTVVTNFSTQLTFQLAYRTGQEIFTGVWDLLTGTDSLSLVSLKRPGNYSTGMISGSGLFPPNGLVNFQVNYQGFSGNQAQLVISGNEVLNPINQPLSE